MLRETVGRAVNNNSKSHTWLDFKFDRFKKEILLCNIFSKIRMLLCYQTINIQRLLYTVIKFFNAVKILLRE